MELVGKGGGVGEADGVEGFLAPAGAVGPGLPVEDDDVEWDGAAAVFADDFCHFAGVDVSLFGLHVTEEPLGWEWSLASEEMVVAGEVVEFLAADEVEVELVDDVGPPVGAEGVVVEGQEGGAVEQNSVASGGDEAGDYGFHVLLVELADLPRRLP